MRRIHNNLHQYGLKQHEYEAMLEQQLNVCAICQEPPKPGKLLYVDHDHETAEIRGLLCSSCNTGIGLFKDRVRLLAAAIVYLQDNGKSYR